MNSDRRGKMLEAIFREKQLYVMKNSSATHTSGTAIDLTAVLPGSTADMSWMVLPSPLSSDHYPILLEIGVDGWCEGIVRPQRNDGGGCATMHERPECCLSRALVHM